MVRSTGIEPVAYGLEGRRSIRLSYERVHKTVFEEKPVLQRNSEGKSGRGERIRTSGPRFPKPMRYQAALHPDT